MERKIKLSTQLELKEPFRVLCVVTKMNRGGLENRLMDIYRSINRELIQFDFYTFRETKGDYDNEIINLGGKVYYNKEINIFNMVTIPKRLYNFLNNHEYYKVIHSHINQWSGIVLMGAYFAKVPFRIAHSRTSINRLSIKTLAKNIIKYPTRYFATHKFAVSLVAARWLFGNRNLELGKVEIWKNAIDYKKFLFDNDLRVEVRNELGLTNEFSFIHVGNFIAEKNHQFLINIFNEYIKFNPNSKLILIGQDSKNSKIRKLVEKLKINEKVIFLGSRSDVNRLLQGADVFVFPSVFEGLPGAVLEAQAADLTCFISDTITDEVCITPNITKLSIHLSNKVWAERIFNHEYKLRTNTTDYFIEAGFELSFVSKRLENFYWNCYKEILVEK